MKLALVILLCAVALLANGHAALPPSQGNIICYYSSWATYRPSLGAYNIENIRADICTHLIYAFVGLDEATWTLKILDPTLDVEKENFKKFVALKEQNPSLKTMVAVGGWGEGGAKYSDMVSVASQRATFIQSTVDFLKQYNFDGLDIDWEYPGASDRGGKYTDKDNYLAFVQELRKAFDAEGKGWLLTAAVPMAKFRLDDGYQVPELSEALDHIHIMSYDLRGMWCGWCDVHTPLHKRSFDEYAYEKLNVADGLQLWEDYGAPRNKLMMGLAFYGRTFWLGDPSNHDIHAPVNQWGDHPDGGDPGPYTNASGTLSYYEICNYINTDKNWTLERDDVGMAPWMYQGRNWVGYEDVDSLTAKLEYLKAGGYGGSMVWSIDYDDYNALCGTKDVLLELVYSEMKDYTPVAPTTTPHSTQSVDPSRPTTEGTTKGSTTTSGPRPTPPDGQPTCGYDGETFTHQDCDKYWWCVDGTAELETCSAGTVWNPAKQQCDWPADTDCSGCNMPSLAWSYNKPTKSWLRTHGVNSGL